MFNKKIYYLFIFGLLGSFAFPPLYFIVGLPFAFYYIISELIKIPFTENNIKNYKLSFLYGLIFGFAYMLGQLYWISFSLFVDIKTYFWLFPFALTIIPLLCSLFIAFACLLFYTLIQRFSIKNKFLITILFSFCYVFFEFLRGLIFPWNLFAYVLGFSDVLIQPVSFLNIYIFNFLLIIFFSFSFVMFNYISEKRKIVFIKQNIYYLFFYIPFLLFIIIFGVYRLYNSKIFNLNNNILAIQANISQTLKWNEDEIELNLEKHIILSKTEKFENINMIIWSESSLPYLLTNDVVLGEQFDFLKDKVFVVGALRGQKNNNKLEKIWNSIFIFQNGKVIAFYDKNILVPFGEYIPFAKYFPFLNKITNGNLEFSRGEKGKIVNINNLKIKFLICYEIIFPLKRFLNNKSVKPNIIINLTNDAWFGNSSGPYQHLVSAKFRAIENFIPIIRVANSGITAYIDKYGRIVKKLSLNKSGVLNIEEK